MKNEDSKFPVSHNRIFSRPSIMTLPTVRLPIYAHSTCETLVERKDPLSKSGEWNHFVEITWLLEGMLEVKGDGVVHHMKAGQIMYNLPNEDRVMRCVTPTARYRFLCFDGPLAEAVISSYRFPRIQDGGKYPAELFLKLEKLISSTIPRNIRLCSSLIFEILNSISLDKCEISHLPEDVARDCSAYIHNNFYNPELSVEKLCKIYHMSRATINRLFRKYLGLSPQRQILNYRLQFANSALTTSNMPINQIAKNAGFVDARTFDRFVKRSTGYSPSELRTKAARNQFSGKNEEENEEVNGEEKGTWLVP